MCPCGLFDEITLSRNSGEGAPQKFSDGVGRDRISGLTGEVELHAHNDPEI